MFVLETLIKPSSTELQTQINLLSYTVEVSLVTNHEHFQVKQVRGYARSNPKILKLQIIQSVFLLSVSRVTKRTYKFVKCLVYYGIALISSDVLIC